MTERFVRTQWLLGGAAMEKLARAKVAIFGVGGVGSYTAEGLARSGVGSFVLVDPDCVSLSNINRQLQATELTLGRPKVEVMRERILAINPAVKVTARQEFYRPENGDDLVSGDCSMIVDAMDMVAAKVDLVVRAGRMNIPIISSMGAGNKLDPTKFEVADIYATSVCPLSRAMRRNLKQRDVASLKVVYSREMPRKSGAPDGSHVPASVSFVPSVAGLIIAGEVVKAIIGESRVSSVN